MVYRIQMLHPNPNASQVWVFRGRKSQIRAMAHQKMAQTGQWFVTGNIERVR